MGDRRRAIELAADAVAAARPFAVRAVLAMALCRSAEVRVIAGDDGAADDLVELLRLLEELGTRRWLADTLELVAVVLSRRGEHEVAAVCLGASEDLRLAAGEMDGGVRVRGGGGAGVRRGDRGGPRLGCVRGGPPARSGFDDGGDVTRAGRPDEQARVSLP